jgi:phospholipase/lecithinase/hemolysin
VQSTIVGFRICGRRRSGRIVGLFSDKNGREPGLTHKFSTPLHHNSTIPLVNQTQQFLTYVQPYVEGQRIYQQSQALVAIWIGINDISDSSKYDVPFPDFYNNIISTLFEESVGPLYRAGYHNFLFINLPPLDRTPSNIGNAHPLPNKTMVDWWDNTLLRHSTAFSTVHPKAKSMVFDANTFLNGILDNPKHYGITNTTSFCPGYTDPIIVTDPGKYGCASIDQYFWFNPGHM